MSLHNKFPSYKLQWSYVTVGQEELAEGNTCCIHTDEIVNVLDSWPLNIQSNVMTTCTEPPNANLSYVVAV